MTLKTPVWMQAGGGDPVIQFSGLDYRQLFDAIVPAEGVLGTLTSLKVSQRGAGPDFSVDVALGYAVITGDDTGGQGRYLVHSDAVENRSIAAPPVSGTRIHRVIARVRDKLHSGTETTYDWVIEVLPDIGGGTPVEPNSAITLALVTVASGQANVTNANIGDRRPLASPWPSRPHLISSDGERPGNPTPGERMYRFDRAPLMEIWDGANWRIEPSAATVYKDRSADAAGRTATTVADDDQLTVTLLANVNYVLESVLFYTADAAGDFKWKLVPPNAGTINGSALSLPASATGSSGVVTVDEFTEASTLIGGGSGGLTMTVTIRAKVWGGDGGTFKLQWSRDGGTGNTVLKRHSFLLLRPVSI